MGAGTPSRPRLWGAARPQLSKARAGGRALPLPLPGPAGRARPSNGRHLRGGGRAGRDGCGPRPAAPTGIRPAPPRVARSANGRSPPGPLPTPFAQAAPFPQQAGAPAPSSFSPSLRPRPSPGSPM